MRWMWLAAVLVGCDDGLIDEPDTGELGTEVDSETDGTEADTDQETDTEADTEADTEPPAPVPVEGTWSTGGLAVVNDPCSISDFRDPADFLPPSLEVSQASTTSFRLGETVQDSQTCTYSAPGFTCGRFTSREDTGVGAELVLDQGLTGNVLSETAMLATLDISATCEGAGCALLEIGGFVFPCAFEATFNVNNP